MTKGPLLIVTLLLGMTSSILAVGTDLRVSANGRYLEYKSGGAPFYWMGDTPWTICSRVSREDAILYLDNRRSKGITVIQVMVHGPWSAGGSQLGPREANASNFYGHRIFNGTPTDPDTASPLVVDGGTPDSPNDYWDHVDFIVREARARGMHIALVPAWGREFINSTGSEVQYTSAEARSYGEFLGARYKDEPHIIWVLGGDREPVFNGDKRPVYRAMAEGLVKGVSGQTVAWDEASPAWDTVLMTYHPPNKTVFDFHNDTWLDFEMAQSGQVSPNNVVPYTNSYYGQTPPKPVVLAESLYEGFTFWSPSSPENTALMVRRSIYQSLFAGACGYTYGTSSSTTTSYDDVWAFGSGDAWKNRLDLPGAMDILHVNALLTPRNWHKHEPVQSIITSGAGSGSTQKRASKSSDGDEILVYYPGNSTANIQNTLSVEADAQWFDPRNGTFQSAGTFTAGQTRTMLPPSGWQDAVLVLSASSVVTPDTIVDNADATGITMTGDWTVSSGSPGYHGGDYLHDGFANPGTKSVRFTPSLPTPGNYEVFAWWTENANRASNVPIDIISTGGTQTVTVNQRTNGVQWVSLGTHHFDAGAGGSVLIRTTGANGYVIADAVRFVLQSVGEFDAWRMEKFSSPELENTEISGAAADPDNDGNENLLEYALGLDPKIANAEALPAAGMDGGGHLTLIYDKPKSVTEMTYLVEAAGHPAGPWDSAQVSEQVLTEDDLIRTIRAVDSETAGTAERRFMRLRVEPK